MEESTTNEGTRQTEPRSGYSEVESLKDKFSRTAEAKARLEEQVAALKAENTALAEKVLTVDALTKQVGDLEAAKAGIEQKWSRFQALTGELGAVDADVADAFEWQYSRAGDDAPDFGEWLASLKSDPTTAPKVLQPFLSSNEEQPKTKVEPSPGLESPRDTGVSAKRRTVPGAGHKAPPAGDSAYSNREIERIKAEAVRTGDWSRWKQLREGLTK